jgi:large subunit ribosomal protein L40e
MGAGTMRLRVLAAAAAALLFTAATAAAETIFVRTLTGDMIPIEIALDDRVFVLKAAIEEANGIPPEWQRLVFAGTEMEDEKTLADYNMHNESTVHLVIRLSAP